MLRAVRFATRFDLAIDPATDAAIRAMAREIVVVSPERIAKELRELPRPSAGARRRCGCSSTSGSPRS